MSFHPLEFKREHESILKKDVVFTEAMRLFDIYSNFKKIFFRLATDSNFLLFP